MNRFEKIKYIVDAKIALDHILINESDYDKQRKIADIINQLVILEVEYE